MYRLNLPDDLKEAAKIEKQGIRKTLLKTIKISKRQPLLWPQTATSIKTPETEVDEYEAEKSNLHINNETKNELNHIVPDATSRNSDNSEEDHSEESVESYINLSAWTGNDSKKWLYGDAEAHQWEVSIRLKTPETTWKEINEEVLLRAASNLESTSLLSYCEVKRNATVENPQNVREMVETCKQVCLNKDDVTQQPENLSDKENKENNIDANKHIPNEKDSNETYVGDSVKLGKAATLTILSRRSNMSQRTYICSPRRKKPIGLEEIYQSKHCFNIVVPEKQANEEITTNKFGRVFCDDKAPMVAEVRRSRKAKEISFKYGSPRESRLWKSSSQSPISKSPRNRTQEKANDSSIKSNISAKSAPQVSPKALLQRAKSWEDNLTLTTQSETEPQHIASLVSRYIKTESDKTLPGVFHPSLLQTDQPQIYHQPQHLKKDLRKLLYYFAIRGNKAPNCAERIWLPQCFTEILQAQEVDKLQKCMNDLMQSAPSTSEQSLSDAVSSPTKSLAPEQGRKSECAQMFLSRTPDPDMLKGSFESRELMLQKTVSENIPKSGFEEDLQLSSALLQHEPSTDDLTDSEIDIVFPPEKSLAVEQARHLDSTGRLSFVVTPDINNMMPLFEMRELGLNKIPSADLESVLFEKQQLPTLSVFQPFESPFYVKEEDDVDSAGSVASSSPTKQLSSATCLDPNSIKSVRTSCKQRFSSHGSLHGVPGNCVTLGTLEHQNTHLNLPKLYIRSVNRTSRFEQANSSPGGDLKCKKRIKRPCSSSWLGSKREGKKIKRLLEFLAKEYSSINNRRFACLRQSHSSVDTISSPTMRKSRSHTEFTSPVTQRTRGVDPICSTSRSKESRSNSVQDSLTRQMILLLQNQDALSNGHPAESKSEGAPSEVTISVPCAEPNSPDRKSENTVDESCLSCGADSVLHSYDSISSISTPMLDLRVAPPLTDQECISSGLLLVKTKQNISKDELILHLKHFIERAARQYDINVLNSSTCGRHVVYLKPVDACTLNGGVNDHQEIKSGENTPQITLMQNLTMDGQSVDKDSQKMENDVSKTLTPTIEEANKDEKGPSNETHLTV